MALNVPAGGRARLLGSLGAAALAIAIAVVAACGGGGGGNAGDTSGAVEGKLSLGDSTELTSATIDEGGGVITVDRPGDPLDGLDLTVPAGSYQDGRDFSISFRPINGHSYGDRIKPISPLISIENGGDYADEIMSLKVPVAVPEGQFAMGFFYDEATGVLEGMPLLAADAGSVTIGTRHFSSFFISMIAESVLNGLTIDTGFKPGVDDWPFPNDGSYIQQGGHCAGQSIAAMWYYYERKLKLKGQPDLYGHYDNNGESPKTPDLWMDDNLSYRLASTVHHDLNWERLGYKLFLALEGSDDALQMLAFAYALHATHAPQFVGLTDSVSGGGHAIVGYKIEGGNLGVADPNFPGVKSADGKIEFVNGAFKPYRSALSATSDPTSFDKIGYYAVSAMIDWGAVGARFAEMENGAVGNEYFPEYTVTGYSARELEVPLTDGIAFPDPAFDVTVTAKNAQFKEAISVLRPGEQELGVPRASVDTPRIPLDPGENKLGIAIWASRRDKKGNAIYDYIDFYRVTVIYNKVTISPDPITGNPGDDLAITATMPAQVAGARFEWDYGDGTPKENLSLNAMHVFAEQGEYTVTLTVYDEETNRVMGRGTAAARIGAGVTTGTGAATPTTTASSATGEWMLTSTEPSKVVDAPHGCYNSREVTLGDGSATTSGKCTWGDIDVWEQTEHSWSNAPPQRLAPGERLQITATVSVTGTFSTAGLGGGGSTGVRMDLVPGGGPQPGSDAAEATEETGFASKTSDITIPTGSQGGLMVVTLGFQGTGGSGEIRYTYEWQGP